MHLINFSICQLPSMIIAFGVFLASTFNCWCVIYRFLVSSLSWTCKSVLLLKLSGQVFIWKKNYYLSFHGKRVGWSIHTFWVVKKLFAVYGCFDSIQFEWNSSADFLIWLYGQFTINIFSIMQIFLHFLLIIYRFTKVIQ